MTNVDDGDPRKMTSGMKAVLWLAAAALVVVAWIFWIGGRNSSSYPGDDAQRHVALAVSLVLLCVCLVWLTRSGGSMLLRGVVAGFLSTMSVMICLLAA